MRITRPIELVRGDKRIAVYPADEFKVSYSISYDHPLLRHQTRTMAITESAFVEEIAPARTFTFLKEVELLRQHGFALGGSLENAVVVGEAGVLNTSLRFDDEFVRHKILDVIGDMALLGVPLLGHVVAHRGGHGLHTAFAAKILEERGAWETGGGAGHAGARPRPRRSARRFRREGRNGSRNSESRIQKAGQRRRTGKAARIFSVLRLSFQAFFARRFFFPVASFCM